MDESYHRYQKDKYKLIGAKVIDIAKNNVDGRKVIILKKSDGCLCHIESPRGTRLTIADQFKYIG